MRELKKVHYFDLRPNPNRNLKDSPPDPHKVAALEASFKVVGYYGGILARPDPTKPGTYQMAYGHSRLEALMLRVASGEVEILVDDTLTDKQMFDLMVRENSPEYCQITVAQTLEIVTAAKRQLHQEALAHPDPKRPNLEDRLAEFLGWPHTRCADALSLINAIERGEFSRAAVVAQPTLKAAMALRRYVGRAEKKEQPIPTAQQVEFGTRLAEGLQLHPERAAVGILREIVQSAPAAQTHPESNPPVTDRLIAPAATPTAHTPQFLSWRRGAADCAELETYLRAQVAELAKMAPDVRLFEPEAHKFAPALHPLLEAGRTLYQEMDRRLTNPPPAQVEDDPCYPKAVAFVRKHPEVSASLLGQRFRLGQARAQRLLAAAQAIVPTPAPATLGQTEANPTQVVSEQVVLASFLGKQDESTPLAPADAPEGPVVDAVVSPYDSLPEVYKSDRERGYNIDACVRAEITHPRARDDEEINLD